MTIINKTGLKKNKLFRIPEGWSTKNVSQVFDFLSTNSYSRKQMNYDAKEDSIYNIHYGDIHATYTEPLLDLDKNKEVPSVNEDIAIPDSVSFLKDGDIVMADASEDYKGVGDTVELINVGKKKVLAGLHTFALRDIKGRTALGYRTYIFKHPVVSKAVKVIATGSKVYGISKTNLAKIDLILPPLPEQQKIATILSKWDNAIDKLTQLIAAKELQKKGLMQQLLTGEMRFPGFEDEWETVKISDFGLIQTGNTPSRQDDNLWNGDKSWATADDMNEKYIKQTIQKLSDKGLNKARIAKAGSILVTCIASIGKNAITKIDCGFNQQINAITTNENFDSDFVYYLIEKNTNVLLAFAGAGAMPMLNKSTFMEIQLKSPFLKEQQKIASVLSAADKEIEILKKELAGFQEQKKGLMQVLLTGEKRVNI